MTACKIGDFMWTGILRVRFLTVSNSLLEIEPWMVCSFYLIAMDIIAYSTFIGYVNSVSYRFYGVNFTGVLTIGTLLEILSAFIVTVSKVYIISYSLVTFGTS